MNAIFDAYDLSIDQLVAFYRRLNQIITFPDGMTTSLGIIYWGRDEHMEGIEKAIPLLLQTGCQRFSQLRQMAGTPARLKKLSQRTGISSRILRILDHDIKLWLPEAVRLDRFEKLAKDRGRLEALRGIGLDDQLAVISAGQTPVQRDKMASQARLKVGIVDETVRLCDAYRSGKNLEHLRAKIYYDMGMDTWQKWAGQTSEAIILQFAGYIQSHPMDGERLIPWPKEVRNGIEWAKMHLEIFAVEW